MRLLRAGKDASLNVKGAYLEVWADMLGSLGVIVAAVVIRFTGWAWVDTVVAVAIGLWVMPRTWVLLKESLNILLEGAPEGVDVSQVEQTIIAVEGVIGVRNLHVWGLTSGKNALTAQVMYVEGVEVGHVSRRVASPSSVTRTWRSLSEATESTASIGTGSPPASIPTISCMRPSPSCSLAMTRRYGARPSGGPGVPLPGSASPPTGCTSISGSSDRMAAHDTNQGESA